VLLATGASPSLAAGRTTAQLDAGKTYTVNSTADTVDADAGAPACADANGKCTLRAAVMQANFHAGADTIVLPAGAYKLTRPGDDDLDIVGDIDVTDDLTIKGAGAAKATIDGNSAVTHDRVMQVMKNVSLTMSGLTIRGGKRTATFDNGGGLLWTGGGTLTLHDLVVEHNVSYYGGGISLGGGSNLQSVVDINHITIEDNTASAAGGGMSVLVGQGDSFTLRNSQVHDNHAYEGAGVYVGNSVEGAESALMILIKHTEIYANHASGMSGGVENRGGTAAVPLTIANSDIHDNTAGVLGAGLNNFNYLSVQRSTVAGNVAGMQGGAFYGWDSSLADLDNDTIAGNSAGKAGGAVYALYFVTHFAEVRIFNSTLAGNSAPSGGGIYFDTGADVIAWNTLIAKGAQGANCNNPIQGTPDLADDASCGFGPAGDSKTLTFGALGLHGGPTRTLVPLKGSPAVDTGTSTNAPATDERGIARPQNGTYDMGAVEVCPGSPNGPTLTSPAGGTTVKALKVTLDWDTVPCLQGYSIVIKRGSQTGPTVQAATGLQASRFVTHPLAHGVTYVWRVVAVGDRGSTSSAWTQFKVK
jgi:CSLREA domain-containing protein